MALNEYLPVPVYDYQAKQVRPDIAGLRVNVVYAATDTLVTGLVEMASGAPLTNPILIGSDGYTPWMGLEDGPDRLDITSGTFRTPLRSAEGLAEYAASAAAESAAARVAAETAVAGAVRSVNGSAPDDAGNVVVAGGSGVSIENAPTVWPQTFPAAPHSHTVSEVGATTVGRAVMSAADAQAARAAIGAGTGNGTSNLTLGTTAVTAAAGNHNHTAASLTFTPSGAVTATNVQDAIAQAASMGGGTGGASGILWYTYRSGAYPAVPTTKPAGVNEVRFRGPVQPTWATLPAWIGLGATQVPAFYDYLATA